MRDMFREKLSGKGSAWREAGAAGREDEVLGEAEKTWSFICKDHATDEEGATDRAAPGSPTPSPALGSRPRTLTDCCEVEV